MRRAVWAAAGAVVLVGVSFVTVFPTGAYLHQRRSLGQVSAQLARLQHQDAVLAARAAKLQTDAEVAKLARTDYGLVRPGQEAYVVLPSSPAPPARRGRSTSPGSTSPGSTSPG